MKSESANLFYKEGSSDKVYQATLEPDKGGWTVKFAYGRRGNALTTGNKTLQPIPYDEAKKVFEALVRSKTAKGYTPDKAGVPFLSTIEDKRSIGWIPQLLNEIEEPEVEFYLKSPEWCAEQKFDGRNRLLKREKETGVGANRKGLAVAIPKAVENEMDDLTVNTVLSGEAIGEHVMCWDVISMKNASLKERKTELARLLKNKANIIPVYTAWSEKDKRELYRKLKLENAEGIVFKNILAHYTPGRPASGGSQVKFKFVATASFIVLTQNKKKRSIAVGLYTDKNFDKGYLEEVGNVTVYPNQEVPAVGSVVEVKYLYAFKGGSIFQPVLLGVRDDIDEKECLIDQLKYKKEEEISK